MKTFCYASRGMNVSVFIRDRKSHTILVKVSSNILELDSMLLSVLVKFITKYNLEELFFTLQPIVLD